MTLKRVKASGVCNCKEAKEKEKLNEVIKKRNHSYHIADIQSRKKL